VKVWFAFLLFAGIATAGSAHAYAQRLYPAQGPLATVPSPQVFTARMHGSTTGQITVTLANGEVFNGQWSTLVAFSTNTNPKKTTTGSPLQPNLASAWDAVYGQGFYLAKVLGESIGQALLTGNQGTVIQMEYFNNKEGAALDSKGNIYKMVW
jgi:hypothetical protein